jgi:hypothetical protein
VPTSSYNKTVTLEEALVDEVEGTRGEASTSERVNELLKRALDVWSGRKNWTGRPSFSTVVRKSGRRSVPSRRRHCALIRHSADCPAPPYPGLMLPSGPH